MDSDISTDKVIMQVMVNRGNILLDMDSEPWCEDWYSSLCHYVIKYFAYL